MQQIAESANGAARIDEYRRQRRGCAVDALATAAVDPLARQQSERALAARILAGGAAERAGEHGPPAEPRDGHRRVGGAAAADHEKTVRRRLHVRLRKVFDLEHLVEHDDPGAQDGWRTHGAAGASAPNPKFAHVVLQQRLRTSGS